MGDEQPECLVADVPAQTIRPGDSRREGNGFDALDLPVQGMLASIADTHWMDAEFDPRVGPLGQVRLETIDSGQNADSKLIRDAYRPRLFHASRRVGRGELQDSAEHHP
jgi:hypothetical protein